MEVFLRAKSTTLKESVDTLQKLHGRIRRTGPLMSWLSLQVLIAHSPPVLLRSLVSGFPIGEWVPTAL